MSDVDSRCFLVHRLTSQQKAVLRGLAGEFAVWWSVEPLADDGLAASLCRLGLIERHPDISFVFRLTALGRSVLEVLTDTGVR